MRRTFIILTLVIVALVPLTPTPALSQTPSQGEACPDLVRTAYATTADVCDATGRNQACYGHSRLQATPRPDVTAFKFNQEGDLADVDEIQSLRLSVMDDTTGAWGITLMRLQANMPDSQLGKNITLLLLGDVEISADAPTSTTQEAYVSAPGNVNVRQTPALDAEVITSFPAGRDVTADGRLADNSWIRVRLPNNGGTGWIASSLLRSTGDFADLDVVDASSRYYTPMQAFTFKSGKNDAPCAEAPDSGIAIKTPEGIGKVTLLINEVNVQIGSTVFFQAQPGADMSIKVIEGAVQVSAADTIVQVTTGNQVTVPVDNDLKPTGPPTMPTPFDPSEVSTVPLELLDQLTPPVPALVQPVVATDSETLDEANGHGNGKGNGNGNGNDGTNPAQEEEKVTLCHNGVTITVAADAVPAHLAHGDALDACPPDEPHPNPPGQDKPK